MDNFFPFPKKILFFTYTRRSRYSIARPNWAIHPFIWTATVSKNARIEENKQLYHNMLDFLNFFNTIFVSSHMYPENPEGTQVFVGLRNMGYISDTARNRTHNLFRPKREPKPLGHSDGQDYMHFSPKCLSRIKLCL